MKKFMIVVFLVGLALLLIILSRLSLLTIHSGGEMLQISPFMSDIEMVYQYTHSVERGPVREYFQVSQSGFTLYKTSFTSQGAGLPLDRGSFEKKDGLFIRTDLQDEFTTLQFRLSRKFEEQYLKIAGQRYKMDSWAKAGEQVNIDIMSIPEIIKSTVVRVFPINFTGISG